jgi:hypothetical protein
MIEHRQKPSKKAFSDAHNRNSFVKIGLQIDAMHFAAEKANQNSNPTQCLKCMRFGHVAKYCKAPSSICARCGDKHSIEQCSNTNQKLCCSNCKGEHFATSKDCPLYKKQQQQRIHQTIDRYTTASKSAPTAPNRN